MEFSPGTFFWKPLLFSGTALAQLCPYHPPWLSTSDPMAGSKDTKDNTAPSSAFHQPQGQDCRRIPGGLWEDPGGGNMAGVRDLWMGGAQIMEGSVGGLWDVCGSVRGSWEDLWVFRDASSSQFLCSHFADWLVGNLANDTLGWCGLA